MNSYRVNEAWRAHLQKDLGPQGLFDVVEDVKREGLFNEWSRMTVPFSSYYLDAAIDVLCGAPEEVGLFETFIGYTRQQIERAQSEPQRWERDGSGEWGDPFRKATRWYEFLCADLYSRSLLGEPFVVEERHFAALQASAADHRDDPKFWHESSQSTLIECALVAIAWGRPELAPELLKTRRKFKYTIKYLEWTRELLKQLAALQPGQTVAPESALWMHFHWLFDQIRHPTLMSKLGEAAREAARRGEAFNTARGPLRRLVFAMIKQRYLLNKPIEPGLRDLIALIVE